MRHIEEWNFIIDNNMFPFDLRNFFTVHANVLVGARNTSIYIKRQLMAEYFFPDEVF